VDLDIDQTGTTIKGEAFAHHPTVSTTMSGSGDGSVSPGPGAPGQQFVFTVLWGGGQLVSGESIVAGRFNHGSGGDREARTDPTCYKVLPFLVLHPRTYTPRS